MKLLASAICLKRHGYRLLTRICDLMNSIHSIGVVVVRAIRARLNILYYFFIRVYFYFFLKGFVFGYTFLFLDITAMRIRFRCIAAFA